MATNVLVGGLPFLLMPFLTRLLLPSEYGMVAMFGVMMSLYAPFAGMPVQGVINSRYVERDRIDYARYVGAGIGVVMISTAVLVLFTLMMPSAWVSWTGIGRVWLVLAVLAGGAGNLAQIRTGIWLMSRSPYPYAMFQVALSAFNIALSLGLVWWVWRGGEGRMLGQGAANLLFGGLAVAWLWHDGWLDWKIRRADLREIASFSLPLIPHLLGCFVLMMADRLIVKERLGLSAAGVYMVAAQLGQGIAMICDAANKAYMPWAYERLRAGSVRDRIAVVRMTWLGFFAVLMLAVGVAISAPWLVAWGVGPEYQGAAAALFWIALGQGVNGMYLFLTHPLYLKRQTRLLGVLTQASGGVGLWVAWWLAPSAGLAGVGAGFAVGMTLKMVLVWGLVQRIYPLPWFGWRGASAAFQGVEAGAEENRVHR